MKARFAQSANNGVDTVSHLEYDFVRNSRLYIFWYDAIQSVEAKYAPLFDRSARSIRLGN